MTDNRISFDQLRQFITVAMTRLGLPEADAAIVGRLMAEAELQGSDGHGVIRLLPYARRIRAGGLNLRPNIRIIQERPGMALLDGDNGMGSCSARPRSRLKKRVIAAWRGWALSSATTLVPLRSMRACRWPRT